jgi:hypothetical protein
MYIGVTASYNGKTAQAAHVVSARNSGDGSASAVVARIVGQVSGRTGEIISLDASSSEGATSFGWVQLSGPAVTMEGANTAHPMVHLGKAGTVTMMLAADNGNGPTTATHTIVVAAAGNGIGSDDEGGQDGFGDGSDGSSGGLDDIGASVGEKSSASGGGMQAWLPYAIVGFLAAFLAIGAILVVGRRK